MKLHFPLKISTKHHYNELKVHSIIFNVWMEFEDKNIGMKILQRIVQVHNIPQLLYNYVSSAILSYKCSYG